MALPQFNPKQVKLIDPADAADHFEHVWGIYHYPCIWSAPNSGGKVVYWFWCRSTHPNVEEAVGPFKSVDAARRHLHKTVDRLKQMNPDGRKSA